MDDLLKEDKNDLLLFQTSKMIWITQRRLLLPAVADLGLGRLGHNKNTLYSARRLKKSFRATLKVITITD